MEVDGLRETGEFCMVGLGSSLAMDWENLLPRSQPAVFPPHATPPTTHLAAQNFGENGEYNAINFAKVSNFHA